MAAEFVLRTELTRSGTHSGRLRQRLLLKNGLHRLRLRFRGVRHGRALRLRLRHGKAHRSGQLPQLLQLRGIIQYGAQRALQLIH